MSVLLHLSCCVLLMQDCVATIPPYPHYVGDRDDGYDVAAALSDPDSMWIVCPQLFFSCTVRPLTARVDSYNNSPDDIPLDLVFFSRQGRDFASGCADGHGQETRRGSHVYEVNTWLWNFGRPQPRVASLSVAKTEKICKRSQCRGAAAKSAWKTRARQAPKSAAEADADI